MKCKNLCDKCGKITKKKTHTHTPITTKNIHHFDFFNNNKINILFFALLIALNNNIICNNNTSSPHSYNAKISSVILFSTCINNLCEKCNDFFNM